MTTHIVNILEAFMVTHDVKCFRLQKPAGFTFNPGQAADVSINKPQWKDEKRPFTFTCLPTDSYLEFTIKTYPSHNGVTNQLLQLNKGDSLILHDVFGEITYKGEGVFIAGGAGVTPFIAIFRYLQQTNQVKNNVLIFANNTKADIILEEEFKQLLGNNFINILSKDNADGYAHGYINIDFLKAHILNLQSKFYVCGPPPMMDAVLPMLEKLGVAKDSIIVEGF